VRRFSWQHACVLGSALLMLGLESSTVRSQPRSVPVRTRRWLEVRQIGGAVRYRSQQGAGQARIGIRLQAVGDSIQTFQNASASLAVDTGIGFVYLSENTTVRIQRLQQLSDGGRLTRLQVTGGQARLKIRSFTNPSSGLRIETPAGWSGVRGTEFGVSVHPDGKTGVATLEGSVATTAQGQSVAVNGGFQSLVVPGNPPSPPVPLTNNPRLEVNILAPIDSRTVQIAGQTDPVNLLIVGGVAQNIAQNGQFALRVPLPGTRSIRAVVVTPLGTKQEYALAVP